MPTTFGDMEKLLEEDVDITLGENVVEVKKKEKKELKPQDEKWQKELAEAGFDPRIRRQAFKFLILPDQTCLQDFTIVARASFTFKCIIVKNTITADILIMFVFIPCKISRYQTKWLNRYCSCIFLQNI